MSCTESDCSCGGFIAHAWLDDMCECLHDQQLHTGAAPVSAQSASGVSANPDPQGSGSERLSNQRAALRPVKPLPPPPPGGGSNGVGATSASGGGDGGAAAAAAATESQIQREKMEKKRRHRLEVLQEIMDTERVYVRNLKAMVKIFLQPLLRRAGSTMEALTKEQVNDIFSTAELLYNVNTELHNKLEERYKACHPEMPSEIGDIFITLVPFLKLYQTYVNHFEKSMEALAKCSAIPAFQEFLNNARSFPECSGRDLSSFLIMPVQRVPRYVMLLDDLIKHTSASHPDYPNLVASLTKLKEVAMAINESKRHDENLGMILDLVKRFNGKGFDHLVAPHRTFIRQGVLFKKPSSSQYGKDKKRTFFLFSDCMVYAQSARGNMFDYKGQINLKAAMIQDMPDSKDGKLKNAFKLVSTSGTYICYAADAEEKASWLADLQKVAAELQEAMLSPFVGKDELEQSRRDVTRLRDQAESASSGGGSGGGGSVNVSGSQAQAQASAAPAKPDEGKHGAGRKAGTGAGAGTASDGHVSSDDEW